MQFLPILVTVSRIFTGYVDDTTIFPRTLVYIPMLCSYRLDDLMLSGYFDYYKWKSLIVIPLQFSKQSILSNFLLLCLFTHLMSDNIQRAMQDLDLGVEDAPVALPIDVVNQAVAENRFIIIGRPVIPRRQNMHSIIASLPRSWGLVGMVHGRIVPGRRFQFVFQLEEAMETVLRMGSLCIC